MKILAIADEESKYLWDFFEKSKLDGIDLIISCGDLDPRYLSFLVTLSTVPVLYVHGNMKKFRRRDAPALRMRYLSITVCGSSGLAVPCATARDLTSTRKRKCEGGWPGSGSSFSATTALIFW